MRVEVRDLHKEYGRTRAVNGITFAFASGQIFGFIGPNGAGKSTTMRVLATLEEPTSGTATIDGVSVVEEPEKAHRLIGYVPDSLPSHRDITVHEYLDFFARGNLVPDTLCELDRERTAGSLDRVGVGVEGEHASGVGCDAKGEATVTAAQLDDPLAGEVREPVEGGEMGAFRVDVATHLRFGL